MSVPGHQEWFLPAKLKVRFTVNKRAFAGPRSNGQMRREQSSRLSVVTAESGSEAELGAGGL